jgi:hypothetical protein
MTKKKHPKGKCLTQITQITNGGYSRPPLLEENRLLAQLNVI